MEYQYIGKSIPKVDSIQKATGTAQYINDLSFPNMLWGKVLRSIYPHAEIVHIDKSKAERLSGVKGIITAQDIPDGRYGPFIKDEPVLARGKVRYISEPVAAVAAIDREIAEEAIQLIEVEYGELPAVFDPLEAMKPDAPQIHEDLSSYFCVFPAIQEGNVCSRTTFIEGDIQKGFKEAELIIEETFKTHMHHQSYMEPSGVIAMLDPSGKIVIYSSTQAIFVTQCRISESLKIPMSKLRVIAPNVGGGFGGKIETNVQPICVALAQKTGLPVKIVLTREEEFTASRPRHPAVVWGKLGLKRDGTFVAKEMINVFDSGAYADDGPGVTGFGSLMARGPYRVPHLKIEGYCVYTNKVKTGAFRGFGNPQTTFASESLIDIAAKELSIDPLEIRLKNALVPGDQSVGKQTLWSVGIKECLEKAASAIGWKGGKGVHQGKGIASINHISGLLTVSAFVRINEDGTVSLHVGTMDIGQGSDTILTQMVAEELGVPFEEINLISRDTDAAPYTWATSASRLTYTGGNAVRMAAIDAREQLLTLAAQQLDENREDLVVKDKKVFVKWAPEKGLTFHQLGAISCWVKGGQIIGKSSFMVENPPFDRSGFYGFPFGTMSGYIFAAQAAEVEVDIETGKVRVIQGASAHDMGHAIHPQNAEGQIEGGFVQGLGYTLTEEIAFDGGKVINPSFADYKIPITMDVPPINSIIVEAYDETGPYGAKGLGEPGLVGVAPAIANAIFDAVGIRIKDLPITPEKVLEALKGKQVTILWKDIWKKNY
jgi:CO/xanthine dehydrogenase Mo-binding subunit